ncbi:MAG: YicC family protein [Bacteroidales bacterium]|nr:YicC family protein [Bacteroidales bacterium]
MLYSMTGFGRATVETSDKKITVEIKSLNSKQMDLAVRVPQAFRTSEAEVRNIASRALQRGKADLTVTSEPLNGETTAQININALKSYKHQILEASETLGINPPEDWYSVLLRFPDVMTSEVAPDANEADVQALLRCTQEAVDQLMAHRREEGKRLEDFFALRIRRIQELLAKVPQFEEERISRIRTRIEDNLNKLNTVEYDHGRFEQEMIFYIEKLDINEEKQRLAQHLKYFMETMAQPDGGQGKKLGFISQEMGREINTLGSKSNQADMQRLVVQMKDELEQIKEQVLNAM